MGIFLTTFRPADGRNRRHPPTSVVTTCLHGEVTEPPVWPLRGACSHGRPAARLGALRVAPRSLWTPFRQCRPKLQTTLRREKKDLHQGCIRPKEFPVRTGIGRSGPSRCGLAGADRVGGRCRPGASLGRRARARRPRGRERHFRAYGQTPGSQLAMWFGPLPLRKFLPKPT